MGLETTTVISGLDSSWPTGIDKVNNGDDHLRLIKAVLKATFPGTGAAGFAIPITATEAELNYSVGVTSLIQTQFTDLQADVDANEAASDLGINPIGAIIMFNAAFANIPANWQLCDGTNGTPNMADKFVYGTNTEVELLDAGGQADAIIPIHGHDVTDPGHIHNIQAANDFSTGALHVGHFSNVLLNDIVTRSATTGVTVDTATGGEAVTDKNIPPYIKLAYIQRIT